jgi:hypothetical protein
MFANRSREPARECTVRQETALSGGSIRRLAIRAASTFWKPPTLLALIAAIGWMTPHIGKMLLANIKNAATKELVTKMKQAQLSDKTTVNYIHVLQSVIASVVNGEGEQVHPRTWDPHFIGLPVVNPKKQNRPTRTAKEIEKILATVTGRYRVLYALLAGGGFRLPSLPLGIGQLGQLSEAKNQPAKAA